MAKFFINTNLVVNTYNVDQILFTKVHDFVPLRMQCANIACIYFSFKPNDAKMTVSSVPKYLKDIGTDLYYLQFSE